MEPSLSDSIHRFEDHSRNSASLASADDGSDGVIAVERRMLEGFQCCNASFSNYHQLQAHRERFHLPGSGREHMGAPLSVASFAMVSFYSAGPSHFAHNSTLSPAPASPSQPAGNSSIFHASSSAPASGPAMPTSALPISTPLPPMPTTHSRSSDYSSPLQFSTGQQTKHHFSGESGSFSSSPSSSSFPAPATSGFSYSNYGSKDTSLLQVQASPSSSSLPRVPPPMGSLQRDEDQYFRPRPLWPHVFETPVQAPPDVLLELASWQERFRDMPPTHRHQMALLAKVHERR